MNKQLILYSTSHCHLCELAHVLVTELLGNIHLEIVEIANDEALLTKYGTLIPVLQRQDNKIELIWPFSTADILEFLNSS